MRIAFGLVAVVLGGCAIDQPSVQPQLAQGIPPPSLSCREFTAPVTVGGQQETAVGQVCQQPDGSWLITQNNPGVPQQVYLLPPEAIYADPYVNSPWYWTYPWNFVPDVFAGGVVLFDADHDRGHNFHRGFHDNNHLDHDLRSGRREPRGGARGHSFHGSH